MNTKKSQLINLIEEFNGKFPNDRFEFYMNLLENVEFALALECLCDWLADYDIKSISPEVYKKIKDLGEELKIDMDRVHTLENKVLK